MNYNELSRAVLYAESHFFDVKAVVLVFLNHPASVTVISMFYSQVKEAMQRIHDRGNIGKLILDFEKPPTPLVMTFFHVVSLVSGRNEVSTKPTSIQRGCLASRLVGPIKLRTQSSITFWLKNQCQC